MAPNPSSMTAPTELRVCVCAQLVRASVSHAERSADAQQLHAYCGGATGAAMGEAAERASSAGEDGDDGDPSDTLGEPIYFNRGR